MEPQTPKPPIVASSPADRSCVLVEPEFLSIKDACRFLGGIVENTLRVLLRSHGVEPVRLGQKQRRVVYHIDDLRRVASALRTPSPDHPEGV